MYSVYNIHNIYILYYVCNIHNIFIICIICIIFIIYVIYVIYKIYNKEYIESRIYRIYWKYIIFNICNILYIIFIFFHMNAYGNISTGAWFSSVSGRYLGMLVFKGTFRHDGHVSQWDLLHFGVWTLKFATRESESKHPRIESIQRTYSWVLVDHLIWLSWCSDASWCYHSPNLFETFWRWEKWRWCWRNVSKMS